MPDDQHPRHAEHLAKDGLPLDLSARIQGSVRGLNNIFQMLLDAGVFERSTGIGKRALGPATDGEHAANLDERSIAKSRFQAQVALETRFSLLATMLSLTKIAEFWI